MARRIKAALLRLANREKAEILSRFFKTGKGQYGEGDHFLGVTVPEQRRIARNYPGLPPGGVDTLLSSRVHEHRLVALLILIEKYRRADEKTKGDLVAFYLDRTGCINNWDLVDLSAEKILGDYLYERDKSILFRLAASDNLWERRIAIMATFAFIRKDRFGDMFALSELLLKDSHDLIHKAVGWMLREIGKRDRDAEEEFLRKHCREMPRTMLRYAIEKFDAETRTSYLRR
jgi:3-methyladenine DNA glycosylase AlkD